MKRYGCCLASVIALGCAEDSVSESYQEKDAAAESVIRVGPDRGKSLQRFDKVPENSPCDCVSETAVYSHELNKEMVQCVLCMTKEGWRGIYMVDANALGSPVYTGIVKKNISDTDFIRLCENSFSNYDLFVEETTKIELERFEREQNERRKELDYFFKGVKDILKNKKEINKENKK